MSFFQSLISAHDCLFIRLISVIHLLFFSNIIFFVLVFELFLVNILYDFQLSFNLILYHILFVLAFKVFLNLLGNEKMSLKGLRHCSFTLSLKHFHLTILWFFLLNFCYLFMKILYDKFSFFKVNIITLFILKFFNRCSFLPVN